MCIVFSLECLQKKGFCRYGSTFTIIIGIGTGEAFASPKFWNSLNKISSKFSFSKKPFTVCFPKPKTIPRPLYMTVLFKCRLVLYWKVYQGGMIFLLLAHMMKFAQLCRKRPDFLAFEGHKGRKAKKGRKGQKNKYGSKSLELPNSARNAKIAKNCQKEPKTSSSPVLAFKGLKLGI